MHTENSQYALFPLISIGFKHFCSCKGIGISMWKLCTARFVWHASMQCAQLYVQSRNTC